MLEKERNYRYEKGKAYPYAWSYRETEGRVADSLVLRWFCRVYVQRVPDATTLIRWTQTIQPQTLHTLNDRVVQLAAQARVTQGRKPRIDGTVVRTAIHHPTDSSLLVDGVRVLSRVPRRSKAWWARRGRARATRSGRAHAPCGKGCGRSTAPRARRGRPSRNSASAFIRR